MNDIDQNIVDQFQILLAQAGQYVCHYTTLEVAFDRILETGKLRFSPAPRTRDPRESQAWSISIGRMGTERMKSKDSMLEQANEVTRRLKCRTKLLCMSTDTSNSRGSWGRAWANSMMWAHYGDGHKGACLVFDRELLDKAIKRSVPEKTETISDEVVYQKANHMDQAFILDGDLAERIGIDEALVQHFREYVNMLFMTKNQEWEGEHEIRWTFVGDDEMDFYFEFQNSFLGIVLGGACPKECRIRAEELAVKHGGKLFGWMSWRNGDPQGCAFVPTLIDKS